MPRPSIALTTSTGTPGARDIASSMRRGLCRRYSPYSGLSRGGHHSPMPWRDTVQCDADRNRNRARAPQIPDCANRSHWSGIKTDTKWTPNSQIQRCLPARNAALSGSTGESPAAIRSALTKSRQSASIGRNSRANVVFPAPSG
jgi:hypothetical protein